MRSEVLLKDVIVISTCSSGGNYSFDRFLWLRLMKSKGGKEQRRSRMLNNPARRVLGPAICELPPVRNRGSNRREDVGKNAERARESFPDRAPRTVPLMQRDWTSGAGLICQEEDVMLGWREGGLGGGGVRSERSEPKKEYVAKNGRERSHHGSLLQTGINQEADDTSDQGSLSVFVTNFSSKGNFHTYLMRLCRHLCRHQPGPAQGFVAAVAGLRVSFIHLD